MTGSKLRNLNMAVAVAALTALLAMSCSSQQEIFTEVELIAALRERGLLFQYSQTNGGIHSEMNGFVVGTEYAWGDERLNVYRFAGRGETVVAASRTEPGGASHHYPSSVTRNWRYYNPYCCPFSLNLFQRGNLIVRHHGRDSAIPDALEEVMGEPFAGDRAYGKREAMGDDYPLFRDLWWEHPVQVDVDSVRIDTTYVRTSGLYQVYFQAFRLHSFACSGPISDLDWEVTGNEIHYTYIQRVVNFGVVGMTEPCDIDWQWEEHFFTPQGLTAGQTYKVFINGEQVAEFVAG